MRPARTRLSNHTLGVVLVGGASRRFGSDKASATFRGQSLLNRALSTLQGAGITHLAYVGGDARGGVVANATHISDLLDVEQCTLRGVVAALQHASPHWQHVMMLACDVPLIRSATVTRVLASLDGDVYDGVDDVVDDGVHEGVDAAVASATRTHWSCIAVRTSALETLLAALHRHEYAMHRAFTNLQLRQVRVEEREFVNVNTREDLAALITNDENDRG